MFSKPTILFFIAALLATSCFNKGATPHNLELLTATPWKYEKAGFGSTDDGIFDALDPRIAGSEKDNTIIFRKDGSGYSQQTAKNKDSLPFVWAFQNNDSTIYFQNQYYKIRSLTSHRLEIYADQHLGNSRTRYTIVLSH